MVILTNPNNPTGTVLRRESLQAIADFIIAHDLIMDAGSYGGTVNCCDENS